MSALHALVVKQMGKKREVASSSSGRIFWVLSPNWAFCLRFLVLISPEWAQIVVSVLGCPFEGRHPRLRWFSGFYKMSLVLEYVKPILASEIASLSLQRISSIRSLLDMRSLRWCPDLLSPCLHLHKGPKATPTDTKMFHVPKFNNFLRIY